MKVNRILLILLLLVLIIPLVNFSSWVFKDKQQFNLLVIDKSVPRKSYLEHKSLFWILNHNKYFNHSGYYNKSDDYFGFLPISIHKEKEYYIKSIRLTAVDSLSQACDGIYVADARGVFYDDWYGGISTNENSTLIYGGFNQNDYYLLQRMKEKGKLIIGEYDMLGAPTNPLIRYKTQDLFDFSWTGWKGKYFHSLDKENSEVPGWIIQRYQHKYKKDWVYSNDGIILLSHNDVIVLEKDIHLNTATPSIQTAFEFSDVYQLPDQINFNGWFQIIETSALNHTIASMRFDVNQIGAKVLRSKGIPLEFPAIIARTTNYYFYYFAGDFAENNVPYLTYAFTNIMKYKKLFYSSASNDDNAFFWNYYIPLMENIFRNYNMQK